MRGLIGIWQSWCWPVPRVARLEIPRRCSFVEPWGYRPVPYNTSGHSVLGHVSFQERSMICLPRVMVSVMAGISILFLAPVARADQSITYEVVSSDIPTASIEYFDGSARQALQNVALPWRTTVTVANPTSVGTDGAEVRADWRPAHLPIGPLGAPALASRWVTVRIYFGNTLRCANTLDVGDAACHGATPFNNT